MIELTNGKFTSGLLKRFATSKSSRKFIPFYAKKFKINQNEMKRAINEYDTLHELFIRELKPDARIIHSAPYSVVSPVDGIIEDIGKIESTKNITVKGKIYSIEEMLNNNSVLDKYINGLYMIIYLSPSHYHRIHSPISGHVINQWTLGSRSYPVNRLGLKYGKSPLSKNYRVITEVKHDMGHLSIVKVGAMFVNSIETTHEGDELVKGKEMAYFTFGSTVILLFEKDTFLLDPTIKPPYNIKVGEKIGEIIQRNVKV